MLRALSCDMAISLVDLNAVLEALDDLLSKTHLLLWHQLVRQTLGLGALPSLLSLRPDDLLGCHGSLGWRQVALLLTSHGARLLGVDIHEVVGVDRPLPSTLPASLLHLLGVKVFVINRHLTVLIGTVAQDGIVLLILGALKLSNGTANLRTRPNTFFIDSKANGLEVIDGVFNIRLFL